MNTAYSILLYQFIFARAFAGFEDSLATSPMNTHACSHGHEHSNNPSLPPTHLRLGIIVNEEVTLHVDLKQTKPILANHHLPIWILSGIVNYETLYTENDNRLERNYEVMRRLGGFTTYQDAETSSAAIYFHERREFDGMIGYEFIIEKLSIDRIHRSGETLLPLKRYGVYRWRHYIEHVLDIKNEEEDPASGVNYQRHLKTYGNQVYSGYPEVLVIVSWDLAEVWIQNAKNTDRYTKIVSNVLTLFNGIDMLYSKLKTANIKINIAGIIMGLEEESFTFLEQCYCSEDGRSEFTFSGRCVNTLLRNYLFMQRQKIPIDSYDIAIFLTRESLVAKNDETCAGTNATTLVPVDGIADCLDQLYEYRSNYPAVILVGAITITEQFKNYPTIAHEMAHLITVMHDKPQFFTEDGNCCGHIMKTSGNWCKKCLSWSVTAEESFNLFFSSPNCCTFINEPRSLYPTGRQLMLTADEQCQCYGYEATMGYPQVLDGFCQAKLQCKSEDNEFHDTVIPMDGTPCDSDKVCWNGNCEEIQIHKYSHHEN